MKAQPCILFLSLWVGIVVGAEEVRAQVVPDTTLSTAVAGGPNYTITGGTNAGNNLYHSFSEFSVSAGGSAFFDNALTVENIFARVTGGIASTINGTLRTNGTANLFLLNPAGILFGPNTSLNIGGSLTATTADSLLFPNDIQFSATNTATAPLLTVSAPIGLQLGANAGPIQVQGAPANNLFARASTLSMPANQTLALIGGQIDINTATILAPNNHIELWALQNGTVNIPTAGIWQLSSSPTSPTWGTVTLRQSSYINSSGTVGGAINIRGRGLIVQDGSNIESSTSGNFQGQGINVQTTEFVDLLGVSHPDNFNPPGITTLVAGSGATAGNIVVNTSQLRIKNGAWINSLNLGADFLTFALFNNARTGDITIHATDIDVSGFSPFPNPFTGVNVSSAITTLVAGGQQNVSGAITVNAERIRLLDGGRISTDLLGNVFSPLPTKGKAGDIFVSASQSLEIHGTGQNNFTSAIISSVQNFVDGQGGNITVNTDQLALTSGGTISSAISGNSNAAIAGRGTAGNITIEATDVQVSDPVFEPLSQTISGITAAVGQNATGQGGSIKLNANSLRVFNGGQVTSSSEGNGPSGNVNLTVNMLDVQGVSPSLVNGRYLPSSITAAATSSFDAGSVDITSDSVQVRDGAQITVSNAGSGNAGNLDTKARTIFLDNGGSVRAEVNGGGQGNIYLRARDALVLRHGSNITTNAQGTSTGGNIDINARLIAGVPSENSDIVANAIQGAGGNISITTQSIFGLEFRPKVTPESDITASSEFGVSGTVAISDFSLDPSSGLVELPTGLADSSHQVSQGCSASGGNSFIATGRGGVPSSPHEIISRDRTWSDIRDPSEFLGQSPNLEGQAQGHAPTEINTWRTNPNGQVELIALNATPPLSQDYATCSSLQAQLSHTDVIEEPSPGLDQNSQVTEFRVSSLF